MMQSVLEYLFGAASFVPHGYCLLWRPDLVALHAVSDFLIGSAYLAIPIAIAVFVHRRGDLDRNHLRVAGLFVAFIVACGVTHFAGLLTLWYPYYGLQGLVKAATAMISVATAIVLFPLIPKLVALPSASALMAANERLAAEMQARRDLVAELQRVNRDLEDRVERRTRELREATQRFALALSSSGISVAAQDLDLRYTFAHNPPLAVPGGAVVGRTEAEVFPAAFAGPMEALKAEVIRSGEPREEEIRVPAGDGEAYLRVHAAPERDGEGAVCGVISAIVDITAEHRRSAEIEAARVALQDANERFDRALSGSTISVFRQDPDLRLTWLFNPPAGLSADDLLGRPVDEALPEPAGRLLAAAERRVLAGGEPERVEISLRLGDRIGWFEMRVEPLVESGRTVGLSVVAIDVSAQKEHQQHLKVVMRELTHRSKNLLAVVQGIARQTAQSVDGLPVFMDRFGARLQALARAHDLLVDESWRGAAIEELISSQLGHVVERSADRITAAGPRVMLKPEAAQNLALALHELSTNAAKYGALSVPGGGVRVEWGPVEAAGADPMFEIRWIESGGPPATPPARKGFGSIIMERLVPRAIDGTAEVAYGPGGLTWTLRFPRRFLVDLDHLEEVA